MEEGAQYDKKSVLLLGGDPRNPDWRRLARHCVALANARGGSILVGIEDSEQEPSSNQRIDPMIASRADKGISNHVTGVSTHSEIQNYPNGGQALRIEVLPSRRTIAATTDGRYLIRVGDESRPLMPEDLPRLVAEKDAYIWELQTTGRFPYSAADPDKKFAFLHALRQSPHVTPFLREKPDGELLRHFELVADGHLTNLGVLWIGTRPQRSRLLYPPAIQFLKFDANGRKVRKRAWTDATLNPQELIEAVWSKIPEWREFDELPDGLFRKQIPHYDEIVVRELLANALVHRPYTTRGDIYINLHPDRVEIHNPGRLPLGVTPQNILHQSVARNRHLADTFHALGLMEKEGSGYDRLYEVLLSQSRPPPIVEEGDDRVTVTVQRRIVRPEIIQLMDRVEQSFELRQREKICLGLIARHESLTALEFSKLLTLDGETRLREWLGRLEEMGLVKGTGRTRGKTYRINPDILRSTHFQGRTSLRSVPDHRVRELVLADLRIHGPSPENPVPRGVLHSRIGKEIPAYRLRKALEHLRETGEIGSTGKRGMGGGYFIMRNDAK